MILVRLSIAMWLAGCATCPCGSRAAPASKPDPVAVAFEVGLSDLPEGDTVVIEEIRGTQPTFTEGGTYTMRGRYTLASRDRALMQVGNMNGERDGGPVSMNVERGSGRFEFTFRTVKLGYPHVSLYPSAGGDAFAWVYFGSGASVWRRPFAQGEHTDRIGTP